ncbi:hypothetical protein [Nostoc sp.]
MKLDELYKDIPEREMEMRSLSLTPGTLVLFNGDKLYHRVTVSSMLRIN